jgi:hypothetical protein
MRTSIAAVALGVVLAAVACTHANAGANSQIPPGAIILWSGATNDIPSGWVLCDGQNGTPNLTDRFVMGAGSAYAPHDTGGTASHQHVAAAVGWAAGWAAFSPTVRAANNDSVAANIPPFYALAYIMKEPPCSLNLEVNGIESTNGEVTVQAGNALSVVAALDAGNLRGKDADGWLLMYSSRQKSWQHFDVSNQTWHVPNQALHQALKKSFTGPLQSFTGEVFRGEAATGDTYTFLLKLIVEDDDVYSTILRVRVTQ